MPEPLRKRRRTSVNLYLDLEATVDHDDEPEEHENDTDRTFIDDDSDGDEDGVQARVNYMRQQLINYLQEDGQLDGDDVTAEEQQDASLLHEMLGLDLGQGDGGENPLVVEDIESDEDEAELHSMPRPLWAELGHANAAVSGALDTLWDDNDERKLSAEDTLYEVSCQPGMEETIAFRIFAWAMQVDSSGPTQHHILESSTGSSLLPHTNAESSGRKPGLLARSAIANPFLRGRVYIESAKIGYVQRLARRVRGLNPASVRPVPRELLLRPLIMAKHSLPDRTFVRLLSPPCPTMTCLIVKDYLLMVPRILHSAQQQLPPFANKFNADVDAMPAPPPDSFVDDPSLDAAFASPNIRVDNHGFRYYPLRMLGPHSLEAYEPSVSEIEVLFKYGRLDGRLYRRYMSRIMTYSFSTGDRVVFRAGAFHSLIGTILSPGHDETCSVYVPSQGSVVQVARQQLRRHFCIGDRVSSTTDDVKKELGSSFGWVVSVSEGLEETTTGRPGTQAGYRVDLRVYSPQSGKEVEAAHYEFQFEDTSTVSLQPTRSPSVVSEMCIGRPYTLILPLYTRLRSFIGVIKAIEGVHVRQSGAESPTELPATVVFGIWDESADAPFGYPKDWIETVDFMDQGIQLGQVVALKDADGKSGTARITGISRWELSLANLTGALKVSNLWSIRRPGPYDEHMGKMVRVAKGPHKGYIGIVKAVNAVGICNVELNCQPIRRITINIIGLRAVDETELYLSLLPIVNLPPRTQTPPPTAPSPDTPHAFLPSAEDLPARPLQSVEHDCTWLAREFAQNMPIKLEPLNRKVQRPYHFSNTFYDNEGEAPQLMVRVVDRKKERDFAVNQLKWLPASDINQTVVHIMGEDVGTLYWTVRFTDSSDHCEVRRVPSRRGNPLLILPRLELAQVNAKRTQ